MSALQTPFKLSQPADVAPASGISLFPPFAPSIVCSGDVAQDASAAATLVESLGSDRAPVEGLIRTRFAAAYEAQISRFMPRLFGLRQVGGPLLGAFGLREAGKEALFLERYLDQPIEHAIAAQLGRPVDRESIVEVGQFAGSGAGAFRSLILHLTDRLHHDGRHWVVFTGTSALRNAFSRLGLQPRELGAADPMHLTSEERAGWGTYYQHAPRVMVGDIREGFARILAAGSAA